MLDGDVVSAGEIQRKGWRQGAVLLDSFVERLCQDGVFHYAGANQKYIVASHDCDVASRSFEVEPSVELLRGDILGIEGKVGNYFWGGSPRFYQLERTIAGSKSIWEFSIQDRIWIPRRALVLSEPDRALALPADELRRLTIWLARRYRRPAFPDAFIERTRNVYKRLRNPLKKLGHWLTGVFLLVVDEELPPETPYEIVLWGSMRVEDWSNAETRASAQLLLDKIEAAFSQTDGVAVKESLLRSEADISIDDLRFMKRWDMDDLTLRGEDFTDPPGD